MTVRRVSVERIGARDGASRDDDVVVEEPLEIRVGGDTLAITMRTPGEDEALALGFLWSEGILRSRGDVASVAHCGRTGDAARGNTIDVVLAPGVKTVLDDVDAPLLARRGTITTSACGVCGRRSIDDLLAKFEPLTGGPRVHGDVVVAALDEMRRRQSVFARTGGSHAASLLTAQGAHVATSEDIGRHNAVDKVIGARLRAGELPLCDHVLAVSGRASFEIVQKAIAARIPIVAAVSAASSLAIELAERANLTLLGFARGGAATVYTGHERVR